MAFGACNDGASPHLPALGMYYVRLPIAVVQTRIEELSTVTWSPRRSESDLGDLEGDDIPIRLRTTHLGSSPLPGHSSLYVPY